MRPEGARQCEGRRAAWAHGKVRESARGEGAGAQRGEGRREREGPREREWRRERERDEREE